MNIRRNLEMEDFVVGDVVQLKSGSPMLTFGGANHLGEAIVFWFLDGAVKRRSIPFPCLQRVQALSD